MEGRARKQRMRDLCFKTIFVFFLLMFLPAGVGSTETRTYTSPYVHNLKRTPTQQLGREVKNIADHSDTPGLTNAFYNSLFYQPT